MAGPKDKGNCANTWKAGMQVCALDPLLERGNDSSGHSPAVTGSDFRISMLEVVHPSTKSFLSSQRSAGLPRVNKNCIMIGF